MVKILVLAFVACMLLYLGYSQYLYVINFTNPELPFFLSRYQSELVHYNTTQLIYGEDPRLYSMLFYATSVFGLVLLFVKIYFENKTFVKWTIWIYVATYVVGIVLFVLLTLFSKSHEGFLIFQKIKNALSSPFVLCFLLPAFIYSKKNNWT